MMVSQIVWRLLDHVFLQFGCTIGKIKTKRHRKPKIGVLFHQCTHRLVTSNRSVSTLLSSSGHLAPPDFLDDDVISALRNSIDSQENSTPLWNYKSPSSSCCSQNVIRANVAFVSPLTRAFQFLR